MIEKAPNETEQGTPISSFYSNAFDSEETFMQDAKTGGSSKEGVNYTLLDRFSTPDLSDEQIEEVIEDYLGIENLENNIELLNESLNKAREYIEEYLHLKLPKEIKNIEKLKNARDILKIFKRTTTMKKGEGLGLSPAYCVLVSVTAAAFEFRKKKLENLVKQGEFIYYEKFLKVERKKNSDGKYITIEEDEGEFKNFKRIMWKKSDYDKLYIFDEESGSYMFADADFRGKSEDSIMSKFLNVAESSADKAYKDGVGIKFELLSSKKEKENIKNNAKNLVLLISRYIKKEFDVVGNLEFDNKDMFSIKEGKSLAKEIEKLLGSGKIKIEENENPYSDRKFQAFKINGKVKIPERGSDGGMIDDANFEVQIVLAENENESGFSEHNIYEGGKKLAILTRLMTSFSEKHLDIIARETSEKSSTGYSAEKIKNNWLKNKLVWIRPKNSKKKRLADKETIEDMISVGITPKDLIITKIKTK